MKIYPLWHCVVILFFFSCNKKCLIAPDTEQIVTAKTAQPLFDSTEPEIHINLTDTIVPANAISVKTFGTVGNGVTDDSNALQKALNSGNTLVFPAGTYIINKTLNVKANTKIYGAVGAVIKTGTNMKGTLLTLGRYFYLKDANDCVINNIKFRQSTQSFKFAKWSSACIYLENSPNGRFTYNFFDFNLPYSNTGFVAIWAGGSGTRNTLIKGNRLISAGIEYAENGASGTTVEANYISNAPADGLVAHGNTPEYCTGNLVTNNVIENSGYMGIEDWGNIDGTIIRNNTIKGTGKNDANHDAIGISAVGVNTQVTNNSITDAVFYYIEVAGSHNLLVENNVIYDNKKQAMGIIINFTGTMPAVSILKGTIIKNNTINNCFKGVAVEGDFSPNVEIVSNTVNNPLFEGINVDTACPSNFTITIKDNNIQFTTPNERERKGMQLYSNLAHGAGDQNISLINNTLTYAEAATGGPGLEFGIEVGIDNTILNGNKITGNNIKGSQLPLKAITSNYAPTQNVSFINNTVTGAVTELALFTIKTQTGNNF
ncbi:right-handed parallel beta-helix repeat-containing protein [Mucilaginibacter antarcticus]|uniref:Right-handed parallel beta-helix repeat-containing protein n=1 Tax=Mucilaginibacter antarcticus TaxID=1855725 RepID=A0ABW5XSZ9_9SPHI